MSTRRPSPACAAWSSLLLCGSLKPPRLAYDALVPLLVTTQAVTGMRYVEQSCGQLIPIEGAPPKLIGYNASAPGLYYEYDPATLAATEHPFLDSLKIDLASASTTLDTDGVSWLGERRSCGPILVLERRSCGPIHVLRGRWRRTIKS